MAKTSNNDSFSLYGIYGPFGRYSDFSDKEKQVQYYVTTMIRRLMQSIKINDLPETIPERDIKLQLFCNGNCIITDIPDKGLYSLTGAFGGLPNAYYIPTLYTVANPFLMYNKTLKIGEECVLIKNDSMYQGFMPMFNRYATLLVENDLTIKVAEINSRLTSLISSGDDGAYKSAVEFLKKIEKGELGVIADGKFLDGIKTQPVTTAGYSNFITQLIELEQYLKASWYNDLGIKASYNMKREAISSGEASMNDEALLPLIDDVMECWTSGFENVNTKYGTNISLEFNSAWDKRQEESDLALQLLENEVKGTDENEVKEDEKEEKEEEKKAGESNE